MRTLALLIAFMGFQTLSAHADLILLLSGSSREGHIVEEAEDFIKLEVSVGTTKGVIRIERSEIKKIVRGKTANEALMEDFTARRNALNEGDASAWAQFADWCAAQPGLSAQAREAWRKVLSIDSDHALARSALGFVRTDAGWKTEDETMLEKGMVRFEGRWMTPSDKDSLLAARGMKSPGQLMTAEEARLIAQAQAGTPSDNRPFIIGPSSEDPESEPLYNDFPRTPGLGPYSFGSGFSGPFVGYPLRTFGVPYGYMPYGVRWHMGGRLQGFSWSLGPSGLSTNIVIK